ncbi:MAG: hypothetical protein QXD05_01010 [Candidatus Pacearchaeota archaeon]
MEKISDIEKITKEDQSKKFEDFNEFFFKSLVPIYGDIYIWKKFSNKDITILGDISAKRFILAKYISLGYVIYDMLSYFR